MANAKQIEANRKNALRSTGPKSTAGKAIAAVNAVQTGLHATRHLVLVSLGETTSDYDAHVAAVIHALAPVGPLESSTANTIASLLWRLRRIPHFEAAACLPDADLPLSPDRVEPQGSHTQTPPSPSACTGERLAYCRHEVQIAINRRMKLAAAVDRLRTRLRSRMSDQEYSIPEVFDLKTAASRVLGTPGIDPERWAELARILGFASEETGQTPSWTAPRLGLAFDHLAMETGRTPKAFRRAIHKELLAMMAREDVRLSEAQQHEERLVLELQAERDRAAAVMIFATESAVAGIQRSEQHLTRQLERNLKMFSSLQSFRQSQSSCHSPQRGALEHPEIGFVFPRSLPPSPSPSERPELAFEASGVREPSPALDPPLRSQSFEPFVLN